MRRLLFLAALVGFSGIHALAGVDIVGEHANGQSKDVSGASARWLTDTLFIGDGGDSNRLSIADGGQVTSAHCTIGRGSWPNDPGSYYPASYNSVIVSGMNSRWNSGSIWIGEGYGSENSLIVNHGGSVSGASCNIGSYDFTGSNSVAVSGSGSALELTGTLSIGYRASYNNLTISAGARVSSAKGVIGYSDGAIYNGDHNEVVVSGSDSFWQTGKLEIGGRRAYGNTLSILDGGTVTSGVASVTAQDSSLAGNNGVIVSGPGSTWVATSRISIYATDDAKSCYVTVQSGGELIAKQGVDLFFDPDLDSVPCALNLNDGGRLSVGSAFDASMTGFNFNAGSTLSVAGTLSGLSELPAGCRLEAVDVAGSLIVNGLFAPGSSPADSTVTGFLNIGADGMLEMEIGGPGSGTDYDHLTVMDGTSLNGALSLLLLDGYSPGYGTRFDLFDWGTGVTGEFSITNMPSLAGGLEWDTSGLYTTGQLVVIPEPSAAALMLVAGLGLGFSRRIRIVRS